MKIDRFESSMGRLPTVRERWRLEREAVLDSRPGKAHEVDAAVLHERWRSQLEHLGIDPAELVNQVRDRVTAETRAEVDLTPWPSPGWSTRRSRP